jgi:DNA-directed RNA polymerase subunit L
MSITQDGKTLFHFKDIDLSIVNALRRIIISEIPNVAINFDVTDINNEDFIINKNTCALHNEFLAHRISLVPICLNREEIEKFDTIDYTFKLAEKNKTPNIMPITSKHIQILNKSGKKISEADRDRIFPANAKTKDYILITKLKPNLLELKDGEEIDIMCKASKNIGMVHARWSPVSHCSFINTPDTEEGKKALDAKLATAKSDKEIQSITSQFYTLDAFRYFKKNKYDEPCEFNFTIESECALEPLYLLKTAFKVLIQKLEDFIVNLDDDTKIKVNYLANIPNFYELEIKDETYTLLNVIQSMIYNINNRDIRVSKSVAKGGGAGTSDDDDSVDDDLIVGELVEASPPQVGGSKTRELEFIGYYNPHPLDNKMILKIKLTNDDVKLQEFLKKNCQVIIEILKKYKRTLVK